MILSFLLGYKQREIKEKTVFLTDTIVIQKTDTMPIYRTEIVLDTIVEPFPVYMTVFGDTVRDTVLVPIPITQKVYEGDMYKAYVSGYKPQLDSISIYNNYIYVREKQKRFGVGVGVGYGIGRGGLSPYIGINVYYKLFEF